MSFYMYAVFFRQIPSIILETASPNTASPPTGAVFPRLSSVLTSCVRRRARRLGTQGNPRGAHGGPGGPSGPWAIGG